METPDLVRDLLRGDEAGLAAVLALSLAVLTLGLRVAMPPERRRSVRLTLGLLLAYFVLSLLSDVSPAHTLQRRYLGIGSLLLLLLACGRVTTLLFVDVLLGRRRSASRIVRDIVEGVLLIVALLVTLRFAGVDTTSLLTTSALLTAIIGLSLQDTLGNLIAGLSLQTEQPFSVGDWLQIDREGLQVGRVLEINWRATRLRTQADTELIVPNAQLARASLVNLSRPTRRVQRTVQLTLPSDLSTRRVHDLLQKSLAQVPGVLGEPQIVTQAFLEGGVQYAVSFFIDDLDACDRLEGAVRDRLWNALHRAGVSLASARPPPADGSGVDPHLAERTRAIAGIDFLRDLPSSAIDELAQGARGERYQAGEIVVRQGELGEALYLCLSGELVVVHTPPDGRPRELARLHHGGMFGELGVMTGEPRSATVQTVSECELAVIEKALLARVLAKTPALAELISQRMAEHQTALDKLDHETSPEQDRVSIAEHRSHFLRRLRALFAL